MEKKRLGKDQAITSIKRFCAYQERAQQEVRDKLYEYGMSKDEVEEILSNLISENFLNEERFAYAYVSGKFRINKWGRWKIYAHLLQKQIDKELSKKAVLDIPEDEYMDSISDLIARKLSTLKESDGAKREKLFRYLLAKGFEMEWIQLAWKTYESKNQ